MRALATAAAFGMITMATAWPAQAGPEPKVGTVQGAKRVGTVAPKRGFVDDPTAFDGAGGRLLYINSDSGNLCELKVLDLNQGMAELRTIDLSAITTMPVSVQFAFGDGYFLVYQVAKGDQQLEAGALIDSAGKVKRKFGPATDLQLLTYDGEPAVAEYGLDKKRDRKTGKISFTHSVTVRALETGKTLGRKRQLTADENGRVDKLDFRIAYWERGYTVAVGIKGGTWDRKEDQRSPDQSAQYDMPAGEFSRKTPIRDVVAHAEREAVRIEHDNESAFLLVKHDLSALQLFDGAQLKGVALEQPFHHYDPKSLQYQRAADGSWFFSLAIDPVNPDAVARKKADPAWLDLYRVGAAGGKADRVARLLVGKRKVAWIASPSYWAVLTKHRGFSRGGKVLELFQLGEK